MGTLGDLLVLGEGPSVVADADVDLLGRACELLWSRAVAATGAGPHVIKLSVTAAGWAGVLKSKKQTLIFGPMCIENVKETPTFRTDFSNFPWQLLGACRPAGFTCLKLVAVHSAARCWL